MLKKDLCRREFQSNLFQVLKTCVSKKRLRNLKSGTLLKRKKVKKKKTKMKNKRKENRFHRLTNLDGFSGNIS